jgi:hypothetical protein
MLVAVLLLAGHSTSWAQSLTAAANPASGAAGVSNSYLTGSGFSAGAITGATVHLATSCAAPAAATAPVSRVTAIGPLRRFQFLIPASLAPGSYKAWVSGTAGATPFNTVNAGSCSTIGVTASVQGTASLGAAAGGAAVTLVDANGTSRSGTTASDGTFAISSAGLVPPFLVKVVTAVSSGPFPAGTTLYSVSSDTNPSTRINVHVLTDLMVRSFYSAQGLNVDDAFMNPVGGNAPPGMVAVRSLANLFVPAVQLWLDAAGIGDVNLISSPLIAYPPGVTPPSGLDAVLHRITSHIVNPADGSVSGTTITDGTITETINPVYSNGLITLNTTTTNAATGRGSAATFAGLAITSALQPVVDGINATAAAFADTVNSQGAALTGDDLLPFYAADFLNDGTTATQDANETADELAGVTITSLEVVGLRSVNGDVAHAIIRVEFSFEGQVEGGIDELFFKNEAGTWRIHGNQQVAEVGVTSQSRTFQGGASFGQVVESGTFVFAGVSAPDGVVTNAVVSGPLNNPAVAIWNRSTSGTLIQGAQSIDNGQLFDQFFLLSQSLGTDLASVIAQVPAGSSFTLDLTTGSFGNPQYTVESNAFTTEVIQFTNVPEIPNPSSGPLSSVVGRTVTYEFTLPQTYSISGVFLFAQIFDGLPNNPNATGCSIGADDPLTLDFAAHTGSGSITFPLDMSACGLNPGVPIAHVNVFLQVEGVNTEDNIVMVAYPY